MFKDKIKELLDDYKNVKYESISAFVADEIIHIIDDENDEELVRINMFDNIISESYEVNESDFLNKLASECLIIWQNQYIQ